MFTRELGYRMPERLWRVSDLSLEWGALRIHSPVAPVRLEELLPRVGGRRRGLEARRHLPRGVGGWLLRAKEECRHLDFGTDCDARARAPRRGHESGSRCCAPQGSVPTYHRRGGKAPG